MSDPILEILLGMVLVAIGVLLGWEIGEWFFGKDQ